MVLKIKGLYDDYPRRYGKSKKIVFSKRDFLKLVNRENGFNDIFLSVFSFEEMIEKDGYYRLNPSSAIIDKIFIDCDFKDFDSEEQLFEKIVKLNDIFRKNDILRIIAFSGGGFHIYIYIKNSPNNKKQFCRNATIFVNNLVCTKKENQIWDKKCPLKLSQMSRVIGTYNPKRKLYCTSLTEKDINSGLEHIKELARKPSNKINYLGTKLLLLPEKLDSGESYDNGNCSTTTKLDIKNYPKELNDLLLAVGIIFEEIPYCIRKLLSIPDLNYIQRYLLITWLYRNNLDEIEIKEILKLVLSPNKLYHCCGIKKDGFNPTGLQKRSVEHQVKNIIENDYIISCKQMKENELCDARCTIHDVLYYIS